MTWTWRCVKRFKDGCQVVWFLASSIQCQQWTPNTGVTVIDNLIYYDIIKLTYILYNLRTTLVINNCSRREPTYTFTPFDVPYRCYYSQVWVHGIEFLMTLLFRRPVYTGSYSPEDTKAVPVVVLKKTSFLLSVPLTLPHVHALLTRFWIASGCGWCWSSQELSCY